MTGLKVIDGTPTAISKYLREREMSKEKEEFNLSEKTWNTEMPKGKMIFASDVKEFISLIEAKIMMDWKGQNEFIDWLKRKAGEKLK